MHQVRDNDKPPQLISSKLKLKLGNIFISFGDSFEKMATFSQKKMGLHIIEISIKGDGEDGAAQIGQMWSNRLHPREK